MRVISLAAGIVALTNWVLPAAAQNKASVTVGHTVYEKWCAACHAAGPFHAGTAGLHAKYKGSEPDALVQRKDLNTAYVEYIIRHGVNAMPPFRKTEISDSEMRAVASYLTRSHPDLPDRK